MVEIFLLCIVVVGMLLVTNTATRRLPTPLSSSLMPPKRTISSRKEAEQFVDQLLKLKTGFNKKGKRNNAIWYYQGYLRDPANGRKLVGIEGIERIQFLPETNLSSVIDDFSSNKNMTLAMRQQQSPSLTPSSTSSYLAHKVFLYVDANNFTNPVTSFRKNKMAPPRKVNPFQELLEWVQVDVDPQPAETSAFDKNSVLDINDNDDDLIEPCHIRSKIMWPGGRTIEGRLMIRRATNNEDLQGIAVAATEEGQQNGLIISHSVRGRKKKLVNRWIAFGPNGDATMGRSNEIYHIYGRFASFSPFGDLIKKKKSLFSKAEAKLLYKRYGKSPAWLAPKKPCEIELHGYRFSSMNDIPDSVKYMFSDYAPTFFQSKELTKLDLVDEEKDPIAKFKPWYTKLFLFVSR